MICGFCDIDEIKTRKLFDNRKVMVVLSNPRLVPGHLLVIPKRHVEKLSELSNEEKKELFETAIKFQKKIISKYSSGCDSRYMPIDIKTPAWFMGYKDVVVIGLQDEEIAIEIVNQKIANSFKAYFDSFWKKSKPFEG